MSRLRQIWDTFLPNEQNRRFLPFMICFCSAGIGGLVGVFGLYAESRELQIVGFFIAATFVIAGFFFMGWLALRLFRHDEWRKEMEPQARVKQPWE